MNKIIDRIFKNWKTTTIGLVILVPSLAAVFMGKATLTEAGVFIMTGLSCFGFKDPPAKDDSTSPSPPAAGAD